jgi:ribosomal protein S18 acetylase RimI-like enzyme
MKHQLAIRIVEAGLGDVRLIREISIQTFRETFEASNTGQDMEHYIAANLSVEKLSEELSTPDSTFYFAVDEDEEPVGYLKINQKAAQTEPQPDDYLEVERVYVLADSKGRRIGEKLMHFAYERALADGYNTVWLGVWEHNRPAIAFYEKQGFTVFGQHVFQLGSDTQTDILMKKTVE